MRGPITTWSGSTSWSIPAASAARAASSTARRSLAKMREKPETVIETRTGGPARQAGTMRARSSCFGTLPLALRGMHVDQLEPLRDLLHHRARSPCSARAMSRSVGGSAASVAHDERDGHLAPLVVGDAEHRDVGDLRVAVEHVLDFLGRDVLTLADDDVLDAAGDDHRAVLVEARHVTGVQPAVVGERAGVERRVDVAAHDLRPLHDELTVVEHLELDAGGGGALPGALRAVGRVDVGLRHDRRFGHAVAGRDADGRRAPRP